MPHPSGPRPIKHDHITRLEWVNRMWPLIAAIASRSVVNTLRGAALCDRRHRRRSPSGSIDVDLITEPSGQRFPDGKQTVLVRPRLRAQVAGGMITSSGSTTIGSPQGVHGKPQSTITMVPLIQKFIPRHPADSFRLALSAIRVHVRCHATSGTPPARNIRTVGWPAGPLGRTSTNRGTSLLISPNTVSASGRLQSG